MNRNIGVLLILAIVLANSGCLAGIHANEGWTEATVEKKIVDIGTEKSYYVLKTDNGLFEVEKPLFDIFNNTRNPDIVFGEIEEGKTYRLHHYGYRVDYGFGSTGYWYPYVVDAVPVDVVDE